MALLGHRKLVLYTPKCDIRVHQVNGSFEMPLVMVIAMTAVMNASSLILFHAHGLLWDAWSLLCPDHTRKNGLMNKVKFLGLTLAFATC